MRLEDTSDWKAIKSALGRSSLVDVATTHGVNAGAIAAAIKRTGLERKPVMAHEDLPPEPVARKTKGPSKAHMLEPFVARLGKEPDAAIAKRANVSTRTVASFRSKLNISGYNRWTDTTRERTQKRRSAIDPYKKHLGVETDAEVGKRAGVTAQAVRNYRSKLGIAAANRRRGPKGMASSSRQSAWRVEFDASGGSVARVVTAETLDDALTRSRAAGLGQVVAIARLGQVL